MRALAARGLAQAVLPPHERPAMAALRSLGFAGTDAQVLARAAHEAPALLAACSSAAAMWVANAATVSPSPDTADGRVHFTPANLASHFHRALEAPTTTAVLRAIFADAERFVVHDPLPSSPQTGDEGAANHTRLATDPATPRGRVLRLRPARVRARPGARRTFPRARRSRHRRPSRGGTASIRRASFSRSRIRARSTPACSTTTSSPSATATCCSATSARSSTRTRCWPTSRSGSDRRSRRSSCARREVPLEDAVATYLFNSQLVDRAEGGLLLVAPAECRENARVSRIPRPARGERRTDPRDRRRSTCGRACATAADRHACACASTLTADERAAIRANVFLDDALADALDAWIRRHYRDRLAPEDLADPALLDESRRALDELSQLLRLGSVYPFQR